MFFFPGYFIENKTKTKIDNSQKNPIRVWPNNFANQKNKL